MRLDIKLLMKVGVLIGSSVVDMAEGLRLPLDMTRINRYDKLTNS